jgi:hypothetical protein
MKFTRNILLIALALGLGTEGFTQTNQVPGPSDYPGFSRFITDRNIFDPNRQPHSYGGRVRQTRTRTRSSGAPYFGLVGIMSYSKGMFAFFNANDPGMKQVVTASQKIGDYTVTDITANEVKLVSNDKKQKLTLKIGDVMRQENGAWILSDAGEIPTESNNTEETASSDASSSGESSATTETPAASSSASEPNEILKRLMQQREKENQ